MTNAPTNSEIQSPITETPSTPEPTVYEYYHEPEPQPEATPDYYYGGESIPESTPEQNPVTHAPVPPPAPIKLRSFMPEVWFFDDISNIGFCG